MQRPLVSIVVAAYNAEPYIDNCIEGIGRQTLQDYEVLIIDDGSVDATTDIALEYTRKDRRVRLIREKHRGVWHSRQVGIERAQGEYSIHIDVDDWIAPTMLEEMYRAAVKEDADMLICDYIEETKDGAIYRCQQPTNLSSGEVTEDIINRNGKLWGALWNKLIRTECYRKYDVHFPIGVDMCEDSITVCRLLEHRPRLAYLPKAYYHYDRTRNQSSLTNTYLNVSRKYCEQEIRYRTEILALSQISGQARRKLTDELLNLAYITLHKSMFNKEEWLDTFSSFRDKFKESSLGYKKWLVVWAQGGRFQTVRWIRNLLVMVSSLYSK